MPSGRRTRRRLIVWLLLPAVAVLAGAAFLQFHLLREASGLLAGWESSGLPGKAPAVKGPSLAFAWPPQVAWHEIRWIDPRGGESTCRRASMTISLGSLLHGRIHFDRIVLTDLELSADPRWSRLAGIAVAALPDTAIENGLSVRPADDAVRLEASPVRTGPSGPVIESLDAWIWSIRRGSWGGHGWIRFPEDRGIEVRATGEGSLGSRRATVRLESHVGPSLRLAWNQPIDDVPSWELSGTGLAPVLASLLAIEPGEPADPHAPSVGFRLTGAAGQESAGEIHVDGFPVAGEGEETVRGVGTVCFGGGGVTLEEAVLRGPDTDLQLRADLPTVPGAPPGSCLVSGTWRGERFVIEGSIALLSTDGLRIAIDAATKGRVESGPADLRVLWGQQRPGREGMGAALIAQGAAQIGGGTLRLREGRAGEGSIAFTLESDRVPLEDLAVWLPFSVPGTWSGRLQGESEFRALRRGWVSSGAVSLHEGRVEDLPFLEEILRRLPGGFESTAVRFDSLQARWRFDTGDLLAEELRIDGRELLLDGEISYSASADSIAGWFRARPAQDRLVGRLLRLFGEEKAGLDFLLSGGATAIVVSLTDQDGRQARAEEIEKLRNRWPASRH